MERLLSLKLLMVSQVHHRPAKWVNQASFAVFQGLLLVTIVNTRRVKKRARTPSLRSILVLALSFSLLRSPTPRICSMTREHWVITSVYTDAVKVGFKLLFNPVLAPYIVSGGTGYQVGAGQTGAHDQDGESHLPSFMKDMTMTSS